MLKRLIWLLIIAGLLFYGTLKFVSQLSIWFEPKDTNDQASSQNEQSFLFPPTLDALPEATNSATVTIHGFAQNADSVELYINDISKEKQPIIAGDYSFIFDQVKLYQGDNIITVYAYKGFKKSNPSDSIRVLYKKSDPKLIVESPEDGASFAGDQKNIEVRGITDPENTLTINGRWARVLPDGTFRFTLEVSLGDTNIEVISSDPAGNESRVVRTVQYSE